MSNTPKWHRELEIFSRIKPLIMLEGNILDSYQFPYEGSVPKGSILRLSDYLHYFYKDMGYGSIVFYDSRRGFYNSCESGYVEGLSELTGAEVSGGFIEAGFRTGEAARLIQRALSQNRTPCVVVMNFASRCIASPERLQ